jgi:hypothetical protein
MPQPMIKVPCRFGGKTQPREIEVRAMCKGLAVHRGVEQVVNGRPLTPRERGWRVTHAQSGLYIARCSTLAYAVVLMRELAELTDWTVTSKELLAVNDLAARIRDTLQRVAP